MSLFKLDENTYLPIINDVSITLNKKFKAVFTKNKDKELALKELGFVWWTSDRKSPAIREGLNDKEILSEGIFNFELPKDWKPDNIVLEAIKEYQKGETVTLRLYKNLLKSFDKADKVVSILVDRIDAAVNKSELSAADVRLLTSELKELLSLATDIPYKIAKFKELEKMIHEEELIGEEKKGGGEIPESYEPESSM